MFNQIHEIVFHGNGGYDWPTVYNMPIWLRTFTWNKINEFNQEQNKNAKAVNKTGRHEIAKPQIKPNYTTKASK